MVRHVLLCGTLILGCLVLCHQLSSSYPILPWGAGALWTTSLLSVARATVDSKGTWEEE